jgi:hypothetical protein
MLLIYLLKILFWVLIIRHTIKWVSYHLHHHNKKTRVFHGNTRMPKELEFALMFGLFAKRKKRFKDLSYRKTPAEWMQLINANYPPDNLNIIPQPNSNPINLTLQSHANPNSNLIGDLGVTIGNQKQFPFPNLKTGNNNFTKIKKEFNVFTAKPCAKNNRVVSSFLFNTKIAGIKNLKNSQNPILSSKQTPACTQ